MLLLPEDREIPDPPIRAIRLFVPRIVNDAISLRFTLPAQTTISRVHAIILHPYMERIARADDLPSIFEAFPLTDPIVESASPAGIEYKTLKGDRFVFPTDVETQSRLYSKVWIVLEYPENSTPPPGSLHTFISTVRISGMALNVSESDKPLNDDVVMFVLKYTSDPLIPISLDKSRVGSAANIHKGYTSDRLEQMFPIDRLGSRSCLYDGASRIVACLNSRENDPMVVGLMSDGTYERKWYEMQALANANPTYR